MESKRRLQLQKAIHESRGWTDLIWRNGWKGCHTNMYKHRYRYCVPEIDILLAIDNNNILISWYSEGCIATLYRCNGILKVSSLCQDSVYDAVLELLYFVRNCHDLWTPSRTTTPAG